MLLKYIKYKTKSQPAKGIILSLLMNVSIGAAYCQSFKFRGTVYDEQNKSVPYASVILKGSTSDQVIKGAMTDESGVFEFLAIPKGQYNLQVSLVGYKTYMQSVEVEEDKDLSRILLEVDAQTLGEVTVTASRPLVSRQADRYVLNVGQSVLASGRSTFDLLNYAPGVMTVGTNISINGNTATKIMVNGRMLRLSGDQVQNYLANLRSEEVESIEVIPNPGAEYEAEGGGGLINIKLKKQRAAGLTGVLGLGATTPKWPSYNTNEQLNYSYKGLQLYASHNYTKRNSYSLIGDSRNYEGRTYLSDSRSDVDNDIHNYRFGVAYDFSDKQYLGIEFNGNSGTSHAETFSNAVLSVNEKVDRIVNGDFITKSHNKLNNVSMNYDWKTDTIGSLLSIIADYTWADRRGEGSFHSRYNDGSEQFLFDSIYRNRVPVSVDNYNLAVNYTKKWQEIGQLKVGAKYTRTQTNNDVTYEYLSADEYIKDESRSNVFNYIERISAAYGQYSNTWGNTSLQIGLRAERTSVKGHSLTTDEEFSRNYTNIFPSVFVHHKWNEHHSSTIRYTRRLDRPTFTVLNPFEWRTDDYTYVQGNPAINPQYTNSIQLSHALDNKYELMIFGSQTDGVFASLLNNEGSDGIVSRYRWQNLDKQSYYGANLYLPFNPTSWWSMTNNLMYYYNKLEYEAGKNSKWIFQGKSTQNFSVKDQWKIELSAYYQSSYNTANLIFVPNYSIDLGISNSFFAKRLTARLLVTDIFNTDKMDYRSVQNDFILVERQKYLTRKFSIQLTYQFDFGKKVKVQKVEAGNEDERNRMH